MLARDELQENSDPNNGPNNGPTKTLMTFAGALCLFHARSLLWSHKVRGDNRR